jgi:hypothetical protein
MLGRILFAIVCLIIATGLLLPIYPTEVAAPGVVAARDMVVAGTGTAGCQACGPAAARAGEVCHRPLPTAAHAAKGCLHLTVYVIVRRLPGEARAGEPQLLPPKLPII